MELQRINKYPALNPQDQTPKRQVPQTHTQLPPYLNPAQTGYNHHPYANYAPRSGMNLPVETQRPYLQAPMMNPRANHGSSLPTAHSHGSYLNRPLLPQANYSPEGYYIYNPTPYLQQTAYLTSSASNEYFNDTSCYTHPSQNQVLSTKCQELENEIQKYKCVTYVNWTLIFLAGTSAVILGLLLLASKFLPELCALQDYRINTCMQRFAELRHPFVIFTAIAGVIFSLLMLLFHRYALNVYIQRNAKAMNFLYWVYLILLILSAIGMDLISIGIYGYLISAASKLRKLFKELEEAKAQLPSQTENTQLMT